MQNLTFPHWLTLAREIQALSQTGITFSRDEYDLQRYQRLAEIAAEIVEHHSTLQKEPLLENFLLQPGYATPKVDVRGAVMRDGKLLLVQERSDGRWSMPGGWADVGDAPSEMVIREVREESGFEVIARKVIGVYDANRAGIPLEFYHAYKIIFLCDIVGGTATPSHETLAVDFFDFDAMPPLSSPRTTQRHLTEIQAHLNEPNRPAAFD
ncbi:NUDIX hydrolase [candidate division KSB1 bacterium]|nr:NUDIX hydrolase [candidate division KSB1 bacterium]